MKRSRSRILAGSIAALLLASSSARAETYTSTGSGNFTDGLRWNFGVGPVPASDFGLTLDFLSYGTGTPTAGNDLNLTLTTLNLDSFGTSAFTISSVLGGDFAFEGFAKINLFGSGAPTTISAPIVLGSDAIELRFDGAGASGVTISGTIASSATITPVVIATDAPIVGTGLVTLSGANTFAGGVMLSTGTLSVGNTRALGDRQNFLTVSGGWLQASTTTTLSNRIGLNTTLKLTGFSSLTLAGVISGLSDIEARGTTTGGVFDLRGTNTVAGAALVGAPTSPHVGFNGGSALRIVGAGGSLMNATSITARDGGIFELNYANGHSSLNPRVAQATPINVLSGFVQVVGNGGLITQSLGTVNAGGLTELLANTTAAATSGTQVTIDNLVRNGSGTVVFQGVNLGGAATGSGAAQGNIAPVLINGAAPSAALVGGSGGAGTTTQKILPWALGDTNNIGSLLGVGSGFVTFGANGARLLVTGTEYNQNNNFTTVGATENMRITGATINPTGATTVNSLYVEAASTAVSGGSLTIASGALATNTTGVIIATPISFGASGAGEAIVSVVGAQFTSNQLTLSGGFTAASLTKSGHNTLSISTVNPTIAGAININGGRLVVDQLSRLGGATALNFNSMVTGTIGSAFGTSNAATETLSIPITTNSGMARIIAGNALIVNSNISGEGGMRFDQGTITLGGNNTYTGGTIIAGSTTVQFDGDARFGSAADPVKNFLTIDGASLPAAPVTLALTGPWTSARAISFNLRVNLDAGANNTTLSGPITGNANITKLGSGTLTITSGMENGFNGFITLGNAASAGGTVRFTDAGALNSASVTFGLIGAPVGTYSLDLSGATDTDTTDGSTTPWRSLVALNTTSGFTQSHTVQLGANAGAPVDLRVDNGTFGGAAGVIAGFGKLVKVGAGTLTLTGTTPSTFTGGVEVRGGVLSFSADGPLGDSTNSVVVRGGIFNYTGAGLVFTRGVTLGATPQPIIYGSTVQTLVNGLAANASLTLNGAIGGSGGFAKLGVGTLVLGTANNYAGDTQITTGTLAFTADNQLGASASRLRLNGGTLRYDGTTATTVARTIILTANSILDTGSGAGGSVNLSGPIVGQNVLTKNGANAMTISGDSPWFFGTLNIGAGNVTIVNSAQFRRANLAILAGTTTLIAPGVTREFGAIDFAAGSTFQLNVSARPVVGFANTNMNWNGTLAGQSSAEVITKVGTGGITLTTNASSYFGAFNILSGSTTLSGNGALPQIFNGFAIGGWGDGSNKGATLVLDNSGTDPGSRLGDTQDIDFNAGELQFTTNGSAASSETIGFLRGAGMTTITLTSGGTLNFADASNGLTRKDRGTFLFRNGGGTLGTGAASTSVGNLTFGNNIAAQLIGGGGSPGSSTISILPYAAGGITAADAGSNFVTYGANGVRVLNTTTEVQGNLTAAGATENVRTANGALTTTTLGTDKTINALNIAGTAGTTRIDSAGALLTVDSGLVLATSANVWSADATGTAGVPLGVQTAELRTGASNTRELHLFAAADLALGAKVTTSGGLTKSGAGTVFLTNAANTYTGTTTVNAGALVIDDKAALGGSANLVIGGGYLRYRGADATLTGVSVKAAGGGGALNGGSAGFDVTGGVTLTLPVNAVSGLGGIIKTGTGVLKLQGLSNMTGAVIIAGGALAIDGASALGFNSRVIFSTAASASGGQTLRFDAPMSLGQDFITNTADAGVGFGFDTNGNDVTLTGTIASATSTRGFFKLGAGNLTLSGVQTWTGATQVYAGTLTLSGPTAGIVPSASTGGYITSASTVVFPAASLVLDNTGSNNNNRLPDVWDSPFGSGDSASGILFLVNGELKIRGNASTATSERINRLNFLSGTVTLENNGQNVSLTSGRFARLNTQTAGLIRGTNLGATPSATSTNFFVSDLGSGGVQLGGALGAEGTPYVGILPGIVGDTSATGVGTELTTYAADTGIRLLEPGEYTSAIPATNYDTSRAPNIALSGAASVGTQTMISALKLSAGASVNGGGALTLTASTVLATGSASITTPVLRAESNAGYAFITAGASTTLTINSALNGAGFYKYGDGTLALTNGSFSTTGIVVGQGTLLLSGANATMSLLGSSIGVLKGATLDLGGMDRTIALLSFTGAVGAAQAGGQLQSEGTIALGANRLTLYDSTATTWSGNITGGGGLTKGFFATGTSTFTAPLAFTGSTVIHAGTLSLAGRGALASTQIDVLGGTLTFDNSDDLAFAGGTVANRVPTNGTINLAGALAFIENANTTAVHNLGTVNLIGGGRLNMTQPAGVTAPSTTTIANLNRAANKGTLVFQMLSVSPTSLGLAQAANGHARIFATQIDGAAPASALIGGGGAPGSTSVSIVPWAWEIPTTSGTGTFVTYGADGFRPLATSEYATNLATATVTTNVRLDGNGQTLSAPAVANSLITGGNIGGGFGFDLTLTSGALVYSVNSIATVGNGLGDRLRTGNSDANELLINVDGTIGVLQMLYTLQGSGGLTKFGGGTLAFTSTSPANSFTGGIRINDGRITYTSDVQLGAAANTITFGSNTAFLNSRGLEYNGTAKFVDLNRNLALNALGFLSVPQGSVLRINGAISGAGTLGIGRSSTVSVFEMNGTNTGTGDIFLFQGHLSIRSDADLGAGSAVEFNNANTSEGIVLRGDWTTSKTLHFRNGAGVNTNGHDATINGLVLGTPTFNKMGNGSLTLTAPSPYSGTLVVSAGSVMLKDRGAIFGGSPIVNAGYALVLDDTGAHFPDRIANASSVTVTGGELALKGSASATSEEVISGLTLSSGNANAVTLAAGSGQAAIVRLTGTLSVAGSTVFRGTNLGMSAPGTANSATIIMTESNSAQQSGLVNMAFLTGGGAAGSPSVSVIKGAFGDTSASGLGTQLVTYDLDKGVRLLNAATEYATAFVDGSVTTDNVRVSGFALLFAPTTVNALWLSNGNINTANPLVLTSGTVLVTGNNGIAGAITNTGGNPIVIGGPGNLTLNNSIPSTTTGGLIKQGAGTLTLKAANSYTGQTVLAGGVVNIETTTSFGGTAVRFQGGELRNTSGFPITIANNFTVEGAGIAGGAEMKVGGAQDITFQGDFTLANSNKTIEVTNTGTTTISGAISGTANVLGIGFTKTGAGTLVLTNANTFGDPSVAAFYESKVTLSAGVVSIPNIANGSTASPLGATPADADHIVFDGGTLRYTGGVGSTDRLFTITQNGGRLDAQSSGALTLNNTGSIVVSGSGPRTFTLDGTAGNTNIFTPVLANGATSADKLSLVVNAATWRTSTAHIFTGTTTITGGGAFQLVGSASLAGTSVITINTSSTFDASGVSGGASFDGTRFQLASSQTLRGDGTLIGGLHTLVGSTLDIGAESPTAAEQLTLTTTTTSSYVFGGTLTLDLWQNQSGLTAGEADRAVFSTSGGSTVALGGTLELRLGIGSGLDSLTFAEGDQWQLFNWGTLGVSGAFTTYNLPALGGGVSWDTMQVNTTGVLVVVPEPSSSAVTLLGLGALALRRRRR